MIQERRRFGKKRQGKKIVGFIPVVTRDGKGVFHKKVSFRLHKAKPNNCSTARRICIVCLESVIRKNDKNYDSKVCKACTPD